MYMKIWMLLTALLASPVRAELPGVLHWEVDRDMETTYKAVYQSLEENRFFVVFEANMGRNMARFAERWGDDYNRNQLDQIRAMVICNIWYTNQIANKDPDMLSLCPLTVTLFEKDGSSTVLFPRPTALAGESPARPVLQEVEDKIIAAIREGLE